MSGVEAPTIEVDGVTVRVLTAVQSTSWGMIADSAPTAVVRACEPHKHCANGAFNGRVDFAGYRDMECPVHGAIWHRTGA